MKENFYNINDVIEAAVRIERSGVDLYLKLYEGSSVPAARDVFNFLAAEEEKHIGVFRKLLEDSADYAPRFKYPGEYEQYLEGIASRMTDAVEKSARAVEAGNIEDAIKIAMELENMSIDFYSDVKKQFEGANAEIVQRIINEEKGHLAKLESIKSDIKF
jgi:rubrerythrin